MSGEKTPNLVLKRMLELLLKVPPLKKMLEFQNQKKAMKFVQKEPNISNQTSNQRFKTYKMNFVNKKTNKQKVLNFVLTFGKSWRVKKVHKLSSGYLNLLEFLTKRIYLMNTFIFIFMSIFILFSKIIQNFNILHSEYLHIYIYTYTLTHKYTLMHAYAYICVYTVYAYTRVHIYITV